MIRREPTSHDNAAATSVPPSWRKAFRDLLSLQFEERVELRQRAAGVGAGPKPSFLGRFTADMIEETRRPRSPSLDKQRRNSADMVSSDTLSACVPDAIDVAMDSSTTSRVSDVTNITYSEEKAGMLREEFFRRVHQVGCRKLTVKERHDLVNEIQVKVGDKFREMQKKAEKEDTRPLSPECKKNDLLKRFRAMKEEGAWRDNNQKSPVLRGRGRSFHVAESVKMKDAEPRATMSMRELIKSFSSKSLASTEMTRVNNSRTTPSVRESGHDDDGLQPTADHDVEDPSEQQEVDQEENPTPKTVEDDPLPGPNRGDRWGPSDGSAADSDCIRQLIEMKMLVAEQQAAIDTLSSRLHNVGLANRRLQTQLDESERTADEDAGAPRIQEGRTQDANGREVHLMNENAQLRSRLAMLEGGTGTMPQNDMPRFSINTVPTHTSTCSVTDFF